ALGLLAAAAWVAVQRAGADHETWRHVADAPPGLFLAAAALTLLTLAQTALSFWIITRRYGHVGYGEMFALIGAAWLLNYLPFRPGLFGRIAYHRTVNRIPVRDSTMALIWANVLSILAAAGLALVLAGAALFLEPGSHLLTAAAVLPALALAGAAAYARARQPEPDPEVWRLIAALASRYAELLGWAARYWVCFRITGFDITWPAALAIAAATTITTMVPLFGNGLGIREWTVGIVATLLPAGFVAVGTDAGAGLAADLVNRVVEVLVAVPLGVGAAFWLAGRRRRESRRRRQADEATESPLSPSPPEQEDA
ncbi:MAG: flippase-like domain-containing protein, partial [Phycisphaerales bacterium]|nr:flippase-like domain-containing protein [Phycisphaerales bacterium]